MDRVIYSVELPCGVCHGILDLYVALRTPGFHAYRTILRNFLLEASYMGVLRFQEAAPWRPAEESYDSQC
ncbi:hypothetical protein RSAG8_06035, partial [Rhizoctonia solani AG-8 WAC10335]